MSIRYRFVSHPPMATGCSTAPTDRTAGRQGGQPTSVVRRHPVRAQLRDPAHVTKIRWIALLVVCMSLTIIGIDNTVLNVAIPTLSHPVAAGGLGASGSQLQWIVDSYTIVFAGLLLTSGSLG